MRENVTSPSPVCAIVTAWNQVDKSLACLATLAEQDYECLSIVLVDNGSQDDTVEQVRQRFPQVEILSLPANLGPTGGYNVGFRHALAQGFSLIFLLNNDTLVDPACVRHLVAEVEGAADVGLAMPKIYYADVPNRIWSVGGWANPLNLEIVRPGENNIDNGQWGEAVDIDDAPFCAVLLTRRLLERIGLPDERYFLYYEDRDFCHRARLAGFRLRLAPAAKVWHVVSASSGGRDSPSERYWMARSSVLFFRKHTRRLQWLVILPWRGASAVHHTLRLLRQRKIESIKAYWRGLRDGLRERPRDIAAETDDAGG